MSQRALTPQEWETLWRLRCLGYAIDLVRQPTWPLEVRLDLSVGVLQIYPSSEGTTIAIPVSLSAVEVVDLVDCRLLLPIHRLEYRLAPDGQCGVDARKMPAGELEPRLSFGGDRGTRLPLRVPRGGKRRGYLLVQGDQPLPRVPAGDTLAGELWLQDALGKSFGARLTLLDRGTPDALAESSEQRRWFYNFEVLRAHDESDLF